MTGGANLTPPDRYVGEGGAVDKPTLLSLIRSGRSRLDAALDGLPDEAMADRIDEEWTRKDVLAHIEAWERRVVDLIGRLRAGDAPAERIETDELNARFHAADRDRSLADVRAGERAAYERLLTAIDDAADEELFDGGHFAWTEGDRLADWFRSDGDEHYDEHLDQLTRAAR
ncbi:MAG TPA: ClbS/DfsB family four-helix bundle protein [Candidatus Limnocylindrales bacterium]|nr:ClbS/DfsB family four-helix bundle protein [Candidatus Limnocylindrales bacterium]